MNKLDCTPSRKIWSLHLMAINSTIACLLTILPGSIALADSPQVFPLSAGLEYTYQYASWGSYSPTGGYSLGRFDSGWVKVTVRDSAMINDSTKTWSFLQTYDILRYTWNNTTDTTYRISDTLSAQLFESMRGHHELTCSSMVWVFPSPYSYYPNSPHVFRYADSTHVLAAIYVPRPECLANWDSIWLSTDSGQFRREYALCWFDDMGIGENAGLSTRLLSLITVGIVEGAPLPSSTRLLQNFPNPFNPSTTIRYELSERSYVKLTVYDLLGRQMAIITESLQEAGLHTQTFHAPNLPSGLYFYRLQTNQKSEVRRMLLLR